MRREMPNDKAVVSWPGRPDETACVRLYVDDLAIHPGVQLEFHGVTYALAASTSPLPGDAGSIHAEGEAFFECRGYESGDAMRILDSVVTAIHLSSSAHVHEHGFAISESWGSHVIRRQVKGLGWGHLRDQALDQASVDFIRACGPRICHFDRQDTFNRISNTLRVYRSALDLLPSDIAFVSFVTCLEGLFTTSTQELSYRLALAIASYLAGC